MDNQEHSLAFELLMQAKENAKRWFIAFVIMVFLEIATIVGFLIYVSLPVDSLDSTEIYNEDGNANYIGNDMNGDLYNGEDKESDLH